MLLTSKIKSWTPYSGLQDSILLDARFKEIKVLFQFKIGRELSRHLPYLNFHFWAHSQIELFNLISECQLCSRHLLRPVASFYQCLTSSLRDLHSFVARILSFLIPLSTLRDLSSLFTRQSPSNKSLTKAGTWRLTLIKSSILKISDRSKLCV